MTGFGKAVCEFQGKKVIAEVKSLNSKQADISTRISGLYREKDLEIRGMIAQTLDRGKIDFSLYVDNNGVDSSARINAALFAEYHRQLSELARTEGIAEPQDWFQTIMRLPDVMKNDQQELSDEEWSVVKGAVEGALKGLVDFRIQEGAGLEKFFEQKLSNIEKLLGEVPQYERSRIDKIKERLEDNLKSLDDKIKFDQNRLEQELIFYIEKLDISEEKQRLANHIRYFRETVDGEKGQGKKLGFIAQEMGREINTLGSKANQSELQIIVVKMKDELEQIKEQVLNVL